MKFAHLGDCHLDGWREPELKELNYESFREAMRRCLKEKVEFILIAGDLFDTPYPSIESLKIAFEEFRKIREADIPVFIIAGSHDYSVSGKTFLDVLEKSGFCKNVAIYEERNGSLILQPTCFQNIALYGFPGRKSGLEVDLVEKIKLQDSPGMFKILMLHTTIRDAIGNNPIKAVDERFLPKVDYLALAHLHIHYQKENRTYCGPTFPNNISELEELGGGSFYIFDNGNLTKEKIVLKKVLAKEIEINDALNCTEKIIEIISKENLLDKILILRVSGILEKGKLSDIDFQRIEEYVRSRGCFSFLKSTSRLLSDYEETIDIHSDSENIEAQMISKYLEINPSRYNVVLTGLIRSLAISKIEDEANSTFEDRLLQESKKILEELETK